MGKNQFPSAQPTQKAWRGMMNRCYTATNRDYPSVGGKGIKVCPQWHIYENFLADMGEKPEGTILRRQSIGLDFTPENCRWEQKIDSRTNRLYGIWKGMRRRVGVMGNKLHAKTYQYRGVDISPDWEDDFLKFADDVGQPPSDDHDLDRIDNDRGYWPGNVRWVLHKKNQNNKSDNIYIEMDGDRRTLQEWCDYFEIDRATVSGRWNCLFVSPRRKNRGCEQIDICSGEVIASYTSVKEASEKSGVGRAAIAKCLSGGNNSSGGFGWRYSTE